MRSLAILGTVLASAVLAGSAAAIPPESEVVGFTGQTSVLAAGCGFPIVEHLEGSLRRTTHFDRDGVDVRVHETITHGVFSATLTANGKSLEAIAPFPLSVDLVTGTVTFVGLRLRVDVPRARPILLDAGRVVLDGTMGEIAFEAGQHPLFDGDTTELCAFFADP
jgi:hypothetical protein